MPVLNKDLLAQRLHQNWATKYPMDGIPNGQNLDDSLTSLNWLHNLNIMNMGGSQIGDPVTSGDDLHINRNIVVESVNRMGMNNMGHRYSSGDMSQSRHVEQIDYKTNPFVKPPFSYATLICMSMRETKKQKITLSAIYNWITKNFMYYRMADPSWQNSIRHNLSLNKCFEKVPRRKDEPGKGGFWRINPEFSDTLENGVFKKRRVSPNAHQILPAAKRIKVEPETENEYGQDPSCNDDPNMGVGLIHFGADGHEIEADEINWRAILNQDITVEGTRVKTEQIIDVTDNLAAPLVALSPPHSEEYNDDLGLDNFLDTDLFGTREPLDLPSSPLDLTVTGTTIQPPCWWLDDIANNNLDLIDDSSRDEMKTPVTSSPIHETDAFDYGREYFDQLAAAFDVDNLFDIENIPSPHFS